MKRSKSKMRCNSPMKSWRPGKKRVVKACSKGREKIIHFGATGYGHNYSNAARRSFRARHRCSTAKDKLTARYWACKNLWAGPGGSVKRSPRGRRAKLDRPKRRSRRRSPKRRSRRRSPKRRSRRRSPKRRSRRRSPKRRSKRKIRGGAGGPVTFEYCRSLAERSYLSPEKWRHQCRNHCTSDRLTQAMRLLCGADAVQARGINRRRRRRRSPSRSRRRSPSRSRSPSPPIRRSLFGSGCWDGYERVPGTKPGEKGSCRKSRRKR